MCAKWSQYDYLQGILLTIFRAIKHIETKSSHKLFKSIHYPFFNRYMYTIAEESSNSKFNWGKTVWKEQISCKHQYCNVEFEKNSELFSVSSE